MMTLDAQQELSVYSHEFCRVISLPFNFFVFLSAQFLFHLCFLECPSSLHIILLQTNSTKLIIIIVLQIIPKYQTLRNLSNLRSDSFSRCSFRSSSSLLCCRVSIFI